MTHWHALRRATALAVLASLVSVAPLAATAADPYEVTVILPLTGSGSFLGKEEAASLPVIEALANKSGGIGGRPLKFVTQDTQSSPAVAVQLMNGAVAKKVAAIVMLPSSQPANRVRNGRGPSFMSRKDRPRRLDPSS